MNMRVRVSPRFSTFPGELRAMPRAAMAGLAGAPAREIGALALAGIRTEAPAGTGRRNGMHFRDAHTMSTSQAGSGVRVEIDGPDIAGAVIGGTRPHIIRAQGGKSLALLGKDGTTVYRRSVNHPGSQANDYPSRVLKSLEGAVMGVVERHFDSVFERMAR